MSDFRGPRVFGPECRDPFISPNGKDKSLPTLFWGVWVAILVAVILVGVVFVWYFMKLMFRVFAKMEDSGPDIVEE